MARSKAAGKTERETNAAITDLNEFKQVVIKIAQKYAQDNDWCDVVDEALRDMGLGALLPPTFWIQQKSTKRARTWTDYDGGYRELEEAKVEARAMRWYAIRPNTSYYGNQSYEYVQILVQPGMNFDTEVGKIRQTLERLESRKDPTPNTNAYPIYRVVKKVEGQEDEVVYEDYDDEVIKEFD